MASAVQIVIEEEGKIEGLYLEDHTFSRTFLPVRFVLQFGRNSFVLAMLEANQDAYDYDLHGLTEYLERLETATSISAKHNSTTHEETSKASDKSRKRKNGNGNGNGESRSFKRKPVKYEFVLTSKN